MKQWCRGTDSPKVGSTPRQNPLPNLIDGRLLLGPVESSSLGQISSKTFRAQQSGTPPGENDADDAPFLAAALAAHCVLVTGNLRYFPVRHRRGVDVASPRELVDRYSTPR